MISKYIHNTYKKNIGKIVVTLEVNADKNNESSKLLGKNLCMHIAASKPLSMHLNDLDPKLISKEKEVQLETIKASGKPDNIIEKILDGKMQKYYSECIFFKQQYILDADKIIETVISDFSKDNNFEIISYNLISLGS